MKLALLITLHSVVLTWNSQPGVTFDLWRSKIGEKYVRIAEKIKEPTRTDKDVVSGINYCYYVTATNSSGTSGPSGAVCVLIP